VPRDPRSPSPRNVADAASLAAALDAAQLGDVITVADGSYSNHFLITASGTPDDPIVIRGASEDGTILDGQGYTGNVLDVYVGFGDAMKVQQDGARAVDFYGNEVLSAYDNGVELDTSEGNTRAFRNRFTNTDATISFQPIFGGPVYAIRNVVVNVANEQLKFH